MKCGTKWGRTGLSTVPDKSLSKMFLLPSRQGHRRSPSPSSDPPSSPPSPSSTSPPPSGIIFLPYGAGNTLAAHRRPSSSSSDSPSSPPPLQVRHHRAPLWGRQVPSGCGRCRAREEELPGALHLVGVGGPVEASVHAVDRAAGPPGQGCGWCVAGPPWMPHSCSPHLPTPPCFLLSCPPGMPQVFPLRPRLLTHFRFPPSPPLQVSRFTSQSKEVFAGLAGVCITTFTMVAFSGKRSEESEKVGGVCGGLLGTWEPSLPALGWKRTVWGKFGGPVLEAPRSNHALHASSPFISPLSLLVLLLTLPFSLSSSSLLPPSPPPGDVADPRARVGLTAHGRGARRACTDVQKGE